ncbi:MAG: PD-(D/E)XK nuclease family protein, partial [Planctomycetes bacterium]|nr:PD-(D/E)XK nuclease family protein [Planctomycetota bacterium]
DTGQAEFTVYDKSIDGYRDVQYGDIVILMRSLANRANEYVEMLRLAGIPVNSQSAAGYFATTEITDAVCLLKVLDNPQQDIELAAVLRSPFFKLTDTELAMIRAHAGAGRHTDSNKSFFDCAVLYAAEGPDVQLRAKAGDVLDRLKEWRTDARSESLADLLWRIFRQTGYLSYVSALPNGRQRKANLEKLHDRAIQFEGFTGPRTTSLARFVEYIEKLLDQQGDWAPATPETATDNAVRIISIHRSKGLEFPVVFAAELGHRFNMGDSSADCLIDDPETIGLRIIEPTMRVKFSGMAHQVIAEKKRDQTIAEEMRLLYVAVTRAREKLVLTASRKLTPCTDILTMASAMGDEPPKDWQLQSVRCSFDWLMYALADNRRMLEAFGMDTSDARGDDLLSVDIIQRSQLDAISTEVMRKRQSRLERTPAAKSAAVSKKALNLLDEIRNSIRWEYPHADVTKVAAKQSVSELTHHDDEFAALYLSGTFQRLPRAFSTAQTDKETKADARTVGTATHLIIQHIDPLTDITTASIRTTLENLVESGMVSTATAAAIDIESIGRLFQSDLGRIVCRHKDALLREWPFTLAVDARQLGANSTGEAIVVQGIVDMIVQTPEGLVIIDFKTDNITAEAVGRRKKLYTGQIRYYAHAAGAILRQNVLSAWLYFLKPGRAEQVEVE